MEKLRTRTFRLLHQHLQLDLDKVFYMGKMNLLHISCDTGWSDLARELVEEEGMDVNLVCPSLHMRPGSLTPLMLAVGAGHTEVVSVLLCHPDIRLEMKRNSSCSGHHQAGREHR